MGDATTLSGFVRSIGQKQPAAEYVEDVLGVPHHLQFVIEKRRAEDEEEVPRDALDSIPFHSLCVGLFLPLSGLMPERVAAMFGILVPEPPDAAAREALLRGFVAKELGLDLAQKL